jgi:lipopolysaccharide export system protein LptC
MAEAASENHPGSATATGREARSSVVGRLRPRLIAISERHSRFVGTMKVLLPAAAAALIVVVLAWPGVFDGEPTFELSFVAFSSGEDEALAMLRPRYLGTDAEGRPFTITADTAIQDPADQRRVTLDALQADITLKDGSWITLIAQGGVFHQARKTLALQGPVSFHSDLGYELHTGDLSIDLDAGRVVSESPVRGQGRLGALRADAMVIEEQGARLIFRGNVEVTLNPKQMR